MQRRVPVVRKQDPFAPQRVVGGEASTKCRVGNLCLKVPSGELFASRQPVGSSRHRHSEDLAGPKRSGPLESLRHTEPAIPVPPGCRDGGVGARHDPRGGSLEHGEVVGDGGDGRHELDGRRSGADHGDSTPGEFDVVAPPTRVEHLAAERVDAAHGRHVGLAQQPGGHHDRRGGEVPVRGGDVPVSFRVVPTHRGDCGIEPDVGSQTEPVGAPLEVRLDFVAVGVGAGPVRIGGEGERVEVGGDVALGAGIRVVPPRATHGARPFQQHEVVDALRAQMVGESEAAEPGTDDRHPMVGAI